VKVALWLPVVAHPVLAGDLKVLFAFIAAVLAGGFTALYQKHNDKDNERDRQAEEPVRNRAMEIMRDYEATGQGWFWETDRDGRIV